MSVAVPEPPVMVLGLTVALRPADGLAVSSTAPMNPLRGVTVIVMVVVAPAFTATEAVLAVILKSVKVKAAVVL